MTVWQGLQAARRVLLRAAHEATTRGVSLSARDIAAAARLHSAEPVLATSWQHVSWHCRPFTVAGRGLTSAAPAGEAADASAPCERLPDKQAATELDQRLREAGRGQGAEAVLDLVEREGERFTELNVVRGLGRVSCSASYLAEPAPAYPTPACMQVAPAVVYVWPLQVTAMQAVADACSHSGASEQSIEAIVRSTPFQTLVGEPELLASASVRMPSAGSDAHMRLPCAGLQTWCWRA
jgi:hypothetical protein